ncbi:hypothetical protein ACQCX2_14850 [Propionibacteriaceae bacterium Y1700]|uniref:hypothetical protein n=1 Tax=Microlunatus sp. Y1700 TaxID=3418487 RepID=UPI003DA72607
MAYLETDGPVEEIETLVGEVPGAVRGTNDVGFVTIAVADTSVTIARNEVDKCTDLVVYDFEDRAGFAKQIFDLISRRTPYRVTLFDENSGAVIAHHSP